MLLNESEISFLTKKKPTFWPKRRKWPPTQNRSIVGMKETLPPIYILNDGTEVKGEWSLRIKTTKKKTK